MKAGFCLPKKAKTVGKNAAAKMPKMLTLLTRRQKILKYPVQTSLVELDFPMKVFEY